MRCCGRPIGEFLARRDITAVFRFLHARGVPFGTIGALAGLSPNRAAEIAKSVRQVSAYDVLERIAIGLQIPRGSMGLGLDSATSEVATPRLDRTRAHHADHPDTVSGCGVAGHDSADDLVLLGEVRAGLDTALARSSVSPRQLELVEEAVAEHAHVYPATAPVVMLARLSGECAEVQRLSLSRQPAGVQARLSGAAALLATMCADALMRLGAVEQARLWYRTAVLAADDSANPALRVLVRAQAAMLPYYFGQPQRTVTMAQAAMDLSGTACASSALAAAAKARALARLGATQAARSAIDDARRLFDDVGEPDSDAAFRFPAKRLMLYLSGAATWLGDTDTAYRLQDEALALYRSGPASLIDPALIRLDRAMCLVQDKQLADAAVMARHAVDELPAAQRTELLLSRVEDVVRAVPPNQRSGEVAALAEYVQAGRGTAPRTLAAGTATLDP